MARPLQVQYSPQLIEVLLPVMTSASQPHGARQQAFLHVIAYGPAADARRFRELAHAVSLRIHG